jgi:hypothetical protein
VHTLHQCIGARSQPDLSPKFPPVKVESWVAATPIVTVFLGSVERRFSVPAYVFNAVARSLGQD